MMPKKITRSRRDRKDEPDAFRRAIERWTIRALLIVAAIVLAFELLAWAVQKVRRCTREMMQDDNAQPSISMSAE